MACAMTMSAQTTSEAVSIKAGCFNQDLIVESADEGAKELGKYNQVTDNHGCQYVSQGFAMTVGGSGIPDNYQAGFTTESGHAYKFQSFSANNAIHMNSGTGCVFSQGSADERDAQGSFADTTTKIEFESAISSSKYNTIGFIMDAWLNNTPLYADFTIHYVGGATETKTVQVHNYCDSANPICSMSHRIRSRNNIEGHIESCNNYLHEVSFAFNGADVEAVTVKLVGTDDLWTGWGWTTASIFAASAWFDEANVPNAEITSVSFNGGKVGDWNSYSKQVALTLKDGKYTGELDLSDFTGDLGFKLVVNGGGDENDGWAGWIGTNNLTVDAPENWVVATGASDNSDCTLNNATTGYQTYTITATWEANPVYYKNWTVKIEGKDERTNAPANGYYLVGTMTDWALKADYIMTKNEEAAVEEYTITKDLDAEAQFKVVKYEDGTQTWYPDGMGNNYGENGEMQGPGTYTIYFRPNGDGGSDWFNGVIYPVDTTGINNIAAETLKTAVIYNINGQRVSQPSRGLYIMNGKKVVLK